MAKIRYIKVEFWTSPQIVKCSLGARLFFIGLWSFCDDGGIHPYCSDRLKMEIFPGDALITTEGELEKLPKNLHDQYITIEQLLSELEKNKLVKFYTVANEKYIKITGWNHQKINELFFKYPNENGVVPKNKKYERKFKKTKKSKKEKCSSQSGKEVTDCQQTGNSTSTDCQQTSNTLPTLNGNVNINVNGNDNEKGERENANPPPDILFKILTADGKEFLVDRKMMDTYVERFPNLNVADSMAKIEGDAEAKRRWLFVDVPTKINWWLSEDAKRVAV